MLETWVPMVREDTISLSAICGLDRPCATSAATLISVGVRLSQPLRARRWLTRGYMISEGDEFLDERNAPLIAGDGQVDVRAPGGPAAKP